MKTDEKFEAVKGKLPTRSDLQLWTPGKYVQFMRFCEFFIVEGKLSVTKVRWRECEQILTMPNHPFHEFLYRINFFTFDKDASEKRFYFKLANFMKAVLGYIRENPSMVTDEMKNVLEGNAKFRWALQQTKIVETALGIDVVVPDILQPGPSNPDVKNVASYDKQLQEAAIKATNLLNRIAKSITDQEIKALPVKDRIMALGRLSFVFGLGKSVRPNKMVLNQINIHSAKREDIEESLLRFNKNE